MKNLLNKIDIKSVGKDMSSREFGEAYRNIVRDSLYNLEVGSYGLPEVEDGLNQRYKKIRKAIATASDKKIIRQKGYKNPEKSSVINFVTRKIDYGKIEDFSIPTYVFFKGFDRDDASAYFGPAKIPFIVIDGSDFKENFEYTEEDNIRKLGMHEAQHYVYHMLTSFTQLKDGKYTPFITQEKRHFYGFKNELLSTLLVAEGTPLHISPSLEEQRKIKRKNNLRTLKKYSSNINKKISSDYMTSNLYYLDNMDNFKHEPLELKDFIKNIMHSDNFSDLEKGIEATTEEIMGKEAMNFLAQYKTS